MAVTYTFNTENEANEFGTPVIRVQGDKVLADFFTGNVVELYERVIDDVTYSHAIVFIADENLVIDAEYANSRTGGAVASVDASEQMIATYREQLANQDLDLVRSYQFA